jgi:hypothetical protein
MQWNLRSFTEFRSRLNMEHYLETYRKRANVGKLMMILSVKKAKFDVLMIIILNISIDRIFNIRDL